MRQGTRPWRLLMDIIEINLNNECNLSYNVSDDRHERIQQHLNKTDK